MTLLPSMLTVRKDRPDPGQTFLSLSLFNPSPLIGTWPHCIFRREGSGGVQFTTEKVLYYMIGCIFGLDYFHSALAIASFSAMCDFEDGLTDFVCCFILETSTDLLVSCVVVTQDTGWEKCVVTLASSRKI